MCIPKHPAFVRQIIYFVFCYQMIETELQQAKINALKGLIEELVPTLEKQGFTVIEFWLAFSLWAEQKGMNDSAIYLEYAAIPPEPLEQAAQ